MVLQLLILVVIVLFIFEGRLIYTMFTQDDGDIPQTSQTAQSPGSGSDQSDASNTGTQTGGDAAVSSDNISGDGSGTQNTQSGTNTSSSADAAPAEGLAGLDSLGLTQQDLQNAAQASSETETQAETQPETISEEIDSDAVVPLQTVSVDDSYFADAVFIGDSRMEGFRNTSGITQGTFLTSVGMTLTSIGDTKVNTSDGSITVYQGLSGRQYGKIYLMLGTNDLGYYDWDDFLDTAEYVLDQFHRLQPGAVIYICNVIYVEEDKITTDYVNNENVIKVNGYLLQACEDLDYCWFLNLNEVFSNGYQSLIEDASSDGVHLYEKYSKMMLSYLKSHYLSSTVSDGDVAEDESEV